MHVFEQFLLIATVHLFAVASPGPDFALILKQSIKYNRQVAIFSSLGIAAGIIVHVTYSLVGIGFLIASDPRLFSLLKYIAAAYFCYVAWHCLRARKPSLELDPAVALQEKQPQPQSQPNAAPLIAANVTVSNVALSEGNLSKVDKDKKSVAINTLSRKKAFLNGFLINALNVKATLFFVSLFSVVIVPETLLAIKVAYGVYLVLATAAWFCLLSCLLTHERVRVVLQRKGYLVDRLMGFILVCLAIQLVLSDLPQ
jgi:threonine/homoserine/homoserine lactone efflux protein